MFFLSSLRNVVTSVCHRLRYAALAALSVLVGLVAIPSSLLAQEHYLGIRSSVALADDATALSINPAGLGAQRQRNSFFSRSFFKPNSHSTSNVFSPLVFYDPQSDPGNATYTNLLLGWKGGGIGFQRIEFEYGYSVNRWSFGGGVQGVGGGYGGFRISYVDGGGVAGAKDYWSGAAGVLVRPSRWLSAGVVYQNWLVPSPQDNPEFGSYLDAGVALRLADGRIELSADGRMYSEQFVRYKFSKPARTGLTESYYRLDGTFSARFSPFSGTSFDIEYRTLYKVLLTGLSLQFPTSSISGKVRSSNRVNRDQYWGVLRGHSARRKTVLRPHNQIARVKVEGRIQDQPPGFSLFGGGGTPLVNILSEIRKATDDPSISGMLLTLDHLSVGQGTAYEIRQALERFKDSGKSLVLYANSLDTRGYFLVSVADSIVMPPLGVVNLTGYAATVTFLRGMLDKLGITAQFARIGKFKSAPQSLTDTTISAESRLQIQALLDDWYEQVVDRIAQSRGLTPDSLDRIINSSPLIAENAKAAGLVDILGYYADAVDVIKSLVGEGSKFVDMGPRRYYNDDWGGRSKIALIFASGSIVTGRTTRNLFTGSQSMGAETIGRAIREARESKQIKAIVFRINSPGGSALASDLIWDEVRKTVDEGKPFIVSMGNVAASGGYYIACAADTIVSTPGAVVGSIGVFSGKMVTSDLYDKLGIGTVTLKRGENADIYGSQSELTETQWQMMRQGVRDVYDIFLERVSEGRDMDVAEVDSLAQGRIYSGEAALEHGLVDKLGGLHDALEIALKRAGLREAELIILPQTLTFWESLRKDRAEALTPAAWRLLKAGPLTYDPIADVLTR